MAIQLTKRRFSIAEYYRMAEVNILHHTERLELIDGEIVNLGKISCQHASSEMVIMKALFNFDVNDQFHVRCKGPVQLNEYTEVQPDVCLLRRREDYYASRHPIPTDAFLLVEVSDSTLDYDQEVKLPLYAQANIPEVWIVNLPEQKIEIYAQPSAGKYQTTRTIKRGETIQSATTENLTIGSETILP